jgi:hypothetical protein
MKKITHENFVKQIKQILPDIKIIGEYTLTKNKILVEDKLGLKYNVYPGSLLKGCYPTIKTSDNVEEYIRTILKVKNNLTYISGYTNFNDKILVKDNDDIIYKCWCGDLLRKDFSTPSLKSAIDKTDGFIKKSKKIHGEIYDYSLVKYYDTRKLINIICPTHGIFSQQPVNHLRGCGCPKCGVENTINNLTTNHIGWTLEKWKSVGIKNNGNPVVYIIKIYNKYESFIKIGRTYKSINERMLFLSHLGYEYDILNIINGDYEFVYNKERDLLNKFKNHKYNPLLKFNGYQECFEEIILNYINED